MITIVYDEAPCNHYKVEIKRADFDIAQHKEIGHIKRLTGSEHYIRRILQAVRSGVLRVDDIEVYFKDILMEVSKEGNFLNPWPDELFESSFHLLFNDYPKEPSYAGE